MLTQKICTWMFIAALFIMAPKWKQSKYPLAVISIIWTNVWVFSALLLIKSKKWEQVKHSLVSKEITLQGKCGILCIHKKVWSTMWMNLKNINAKWKKSDTKEDMLHDSIYVNFLEKNNYKDRKNYLSRAEDWLQTGIRELWGFNRNIVGFLDSSVGKESACNAGDPGSIPRLGRFAGEGIGHPC